MKKQNVAERLAEAANNAVKKSTKRDPGGLVLDSVALQQLIKQGYTCPDCGKVHKKVIFPCRAKKA